MLAFKIKISVIAFFALLCLQGRAPSSISTLYKYGEEYDLSQKMSINMQESSLKNVLMLIAELTGLNIVVTPEVQDTITANLENVSVKAALDVILIPNGYNYTTQENIIIVKEQGLQFERDLITKVILQEEVSFLRTLDSGLKRLDNLISKKKKNQWR